MVLKPRVPLHELFPSSSGWQSPLARQHLQAVEKRTATRCCLVKQGRQFKGAQASRPGKRTVSQSKSGSLSQRSQRKTTAQPLLRAAQWARATAPQSHPHRKKHPHPQKDCAICRFLQRRKAWSVSVASVPSANAPGKRLVWLREKPAHWGGKWGLGCVCCHHLASKIADSPCNHRRRRLTSKWARYEVAGVKSMQSSALALHARSALHKFAVQVWRNPDQVQLVLSAMTAFENNL